MKKLLTISLLLITGCLYAQPVPAQNVQKKVSDGTLIGNLTVGTGSSLIPSGSGVITATNVPGGGITGTVAIANGGTGASTASGARTNLGLGDSATRNVGTTAGTVAAGDDSRIVGALQAINNLDDLDNAATARTNLSLGSISTQDADFVTITGGLITGATVTGLPSPSAASDAVTKAYADSLSAGITPRDSCSVATTANVTLSGEQTIDGVLTSSTRILVKNQIATEENGIYVTAAGAWSRATDSNTAGELLEGYYYFVSSGTTNGGTGWFIQTAPTVLGTDPVLFSQFSASQVYTAGTGVSIVGNAISIGQAVATTSTPRFGLLGIGSPASANVGVYIANGATSSTSAYGTLNVATAQSGVTTLYASFFSQPSTAAASFTLANLRHFQASGGGTLGAGSAITNQTGFFVDSNFTNIGATNNYGFRGAIAYGSNRYNLYMDGTAQNYLAGDLGIGGTPGTGPRLLIGGNATGQTTKYGIYQGQTVQSDVTTAFVVSQSAPNTAASSFTLPSLTHFSAAQGTIGSGSSVTNQYGFSASSTLTGATNNYGFYGNIASGPNRWNLYMAGTAANYLGGATTINAPLTITDNSNIRTTKSGLNLIVNVKDYGAVGNGSTDDTSAINSAIAALTNNSCLYFPPGKYRLASSPSGFSSLSYVTVTGDGAEIYNDTGSAGTNTFVFNTTCSNIDVHGLRFTGSSTTRGNGIHIRMYASNSRITNNFLQGCSDFAIQVDNPASSWTENVLVANNTITGTKGDGIHVSAATEVLVANNVISGTGDDAIGIVADNASYQPNRVLVIGNVIRDAGSRGVVVAEAVDVVVTGNEIYNSVQSNIEIGRYTSTTAYNYRVLVTENKCMYGCSTVGPLGSIWIKFSNGCVVRNNTVEGVNSGYGIAWLDCNSLNIQGNYLLNLPSRAVASDDTTTTNVAATWNKILIADNIVDSNASLQGYYINPNGSSTITNLLMDNNRAINSPSGDYIYYDRVTTGKIVNNTSLEGRSISAGGTVSGVTTANNN